MVPHGLSLRYLSEFSLCSFGSHLFLAIQFATIPAQELQGGAGQSQTSCYSQPFCVRLRPQFQAARGGAMIKRPVSAMVPRDRLPKIIRAIWIFRIIKLLRLVTIARQIPVAK